MSASVNRQWHLLALVPRAPCTATAAFLEQSLRERGFDVSLRTVQRDLIDLAEVFPLVADYETKPFGWRWADRSYASMIPAPHGVGLR